MKKPQFLRCAIWAASALAMAGSAQAGVIKGTGIGVTFPIPQPSSSQMAATDAVGMTMSESGPGHLLVFPYFSAQAGQTTVVQLVNADLYNGKAIKVHFRGAGNGDALMNFQVLLAPGDVWTGVVTQGGNGLAQLTSSDKSCTYPAMPTSGVPFSTYRLNPNWTPVVKANHTREGSIEAIVIADIPSLAVYGAGKNAPSPLFTAIKPVNGVAACTASALDAALLTDLTSEAAAARLGFSTPSGGVSGTWSIADTVKGATYSGTATAFTAVNERGNKARGNFVLFPQTADAAWDIRDIEKFTSDPLFLPNAVSGLPPLMAASYDFPDLSTPYYLPATESNSRRTKSHLSKLLSAHQVHNQFSVDPALAGKTDWVFAMPTKRYYLGYDYAKSGSPTAMVSPKPVAGFMDYDYFGMAVASTDNICVDKWIEAYMDRETREGFAAGAVRPPVKFCGAASVFSFNGPDNASALSASVTVQKPQLPSFKTGWASIDSGNFVTGLGLPLLGASFVRQPNSGPPSANAGLTWSHSFER